MSCKSSLLQLLLQFLYPSQTPRAYFSLCSNNYLITKSMFYILFMFYLFYSRSWSWFWPLWLAFFSCFYIIDFFIPVRSRQPFKEVLIPLKMAPVAQMVRIEMEKVKISVKRYVKYMYLGSESFQLLWEFSIGIFIWWIPVGASPIFTLFFGLLQEWIYIEILEEFRLKKAVCFGIYSEFLKNTTTICFSDKILTSKVETQTEIAFCALYFILSFWSEFCHQSRRHRNSSIIPVRFLFAK